MKLTALAILLAAVPAFAESFTDLLKRAEAGDAEARYFAAVGYLFGTQDGKPDKYGLLPKTTVLNTQWPKKNDSQAVRLMVLSANQKYPPAQNQLGNWQLYGGFGTVRQNQRAGYALILEAANQGCAEAMGALASYFSRENGVVKDAIESLKWTILSGRYGTGRTDANESAKICVLANIILPAGVREAWKRAEAYTPKKVFAGEYEPGKRRGAELEDLLAVAERVQRGTR